MGLSEIYYKEKRRVTRAFATAPEHALISRALSLWLSERSAARLAHQSGGLGVASSNLAAPTKNRLTRLVFRVSAPRGASA